MKQQQRQIPNEITQVLSQSPAVQELLKRNLSYAVSYSEYYQSQANANQATWRPDLDQYRAALEIERQSQEQQRIAKERQSKSSLNDNIT